MDTQRFNSDERVTLEVIRHAPNHIEKLARTRTERQGKRPHDRKSRDQATEDFILALSERENLPEGTIELHWSFTVPEYAPCTTPLAELQSIKIRDLSLEMQHRGRYLVVRTIAPPNRLDSIGALAVDENDDAIIVQLLHQEDESRRKATDILNEGTILLLKEPYCLAIGEGEYALRVDHLSDVVHLEQNDSRIPQRWLPTVTNVEETPPSSRVLKFKGHAAYTNGNYWSAIKRYSDALSLPATDEERANIKQNRAQAFQKTEQYDAVLDDLGYPNFNSSTCEKSLVLAATALYKLQRFQESCNVLERLVRDYPDSESESEANHELKRTIRRVREENTGKYTFWELLKKARDPYPPNIECASYFGPTMVKQSESRGRGLFTTQAVKAGDLLLCEKAFEIAYADESTKFISLVYNPETGVKEFCGTEATLVTKLAQKLRRNPSLAQSFTALHDGTDDAATFFYVDGGLVVDTFLVKRIVANNEFMCPISRPTKDQRFGYEVDTELNSTAGIWIRASYINHDCMGTARRSFIGDIMVVRAARDMDAGTEITFPYLKLEWERPEEMREVTRVWWNFECNCVNCVDANNADPSVLSERIRLMDKIDEFHVTHLTTPAQVEPLLDKMADTYTRDAASVPRVSLGWRQIDLSWRFWERFEFDKMFETLVKALVSLGFVMNGADFSTTPFEVVSWGYTDSGTSGSFYYMALGFAMKEAKQDSEAAINYARVAYKIDVGEDETYSNWDFEIEHLISMLKACGLVAS